MKYQHISNYPAVILKLHSKSYKNLLVENISLRSLGLTAILSVGLLTGCSTLSNNALYGKNGLIHDRSKEYQKVTASTRLQIPGQLHAKQTRDAMEIPHRVLADSAPINKVQRPEYFYADSGSESVNFKQDGSEKVLEVDEPIDKIWSKAQQFMEFNNLGITGLNYQQGIIESDWLVLEGDKLGVVDSWVKKLTLQNVAGDSKNKLRIQLRADQQNPFRTVISMAHVQYPVNKVVDKVDWSKESENISYKTDMLYELLRFMSKATNGTENSGLLASKFKRSQRDGAVFFGRNANGKPALKISGSLENAWRLVDNSLTANQIDVGTKDPVGSAFYLTFTSLTPVKEEKRGFFEWLHGDRGPLTFASFGIGDDDQSDIKNVSYTAKGQVESSKELAFTDHNHPANQEGFKVWLGGKVVYNFNRGFNKGFFNINTNVYELTAGYQLKLKFRGNATFVTVFNKKGEEAASVPAEELLWRIKDSIPRA
ncbi:MAG: hypothetical protein OFPII_32890 [Osedax symbiont Rs1]|nr:MAG: hypothetical protein OFPII_32890 [Osedax symbiont Rs1]